MQRREKGVRREGKQIRRERKNEEGWEGMMETRKSYGEKGEIRLFLRVLARV